MEIWPDTREFDTWEQVLVGGYVAGQYADYTSTSDALDNPRCSEANPLYGDNPSDGRLIATKVVIGLAVIWGVKYIENPVLRKGLLLFGTSLGFIAYKHNKDTGC